MNRYQGLIALIWLSSLSLGVWGYFSANLTLLIGGVIIVIVSILLTWKRNRLPYWSAMLQGKPHLETYTGRDDQTENDRNKAPSRRYGKAMDRMVVYLAYGGMLAGASITAVLPVDSLYGILAIVIALMASIALALLKWSLGYKEQKLNSPKRHLFNYYEDFDGNEGTEFYERYTISRRMIARQTEIDAYMDDVEKKAVAEIKSKVESGKMAESAMNEEVAKMLAEVKKQLEDYDDAVGETIKASEIIKKYVKVGIEKPVDGEKGDDGEKDVYEPHILTLYPNGDPSRKIMVVTPVEFTLAIGKGEEDKIPFDFWKVETVVDRVGSVLIGNLHDVLIDGEKVDGIDVTLPDGFQALDRETRVFVVTDCHWTDEQRLQGMQMIRPPRILLWVIRMIKALLMQSTIGKKLEDKDRNIEILQESNERLRFQNREGDVRNRMERPGVYPPLDPNPQQPEEVAPPKPERLKLRQAIAFMVIGVGIGFIAAIVLLPYLGWTVIPPLPGG